jgi:hypothetical protein
MICQVGLTNILGQSLLETNISPASQKISTFYGNRSLITVKSTAFRSAMLCGSNRAGRFEGKYSHLLEERRVRIRRNEQQKAASGAGEMLSKWVQRCGKV